MRPTFQVLGPVLLFATRAIALDIIAPDVTVPSGETGVVQADLTCTPPRVGIRLESSATLQLNGHVLEGCSVSVSDGDHRKALRAKVFGPGEIRNAGSGIHITAGVLTVRDVTVTGATGSGILGGVQPSEGPSTLKLARVRVTGSGVEGIYATKVRARDVTSSGNAQHGIVGFGGVSAKRAVVANNGQVGLFSAAGHTTVTDGEVTGNAFGGVMGFAVVVARSTVTGNDANGVADIVSAKPPRVRNTVCGTSLKADASGPWGVCTND
jgi:hypothetical protein